MFCAPPPPRCIDPRRFFPSPFFPPHTGGLHGFSPVRAGTLPDDQPDQPPLPFMPRQSFVPPLPPPPLPHSPPSNLPNGALLLSPQGSRPPLFPPSHVFEGTCLLFPPFPPPSLRKFAFKGLPDQTVPPLNVYNLPPLFLLTSWLFSFCFFPLYPLWGSPFLPGEGMIRWWVFVLFSTFAFIGNSPPSSFFFFFFPS